MPRITLLAKSWLSKDKQGQRRQELQELYFRYCSKSLGQQIVDYPGIKLEWAIWREKQNENLLLSVHTTAMQLISGLDNEN